MNPDDIRRLFPNASRSLLAANSAASELPKPEVSPRAEEGMPAAVRPKLERRARHAALGAAKAKGGDPGRFLVRVTSVRRRLIDDDNLCEKFVVDCCRYAGLIPGDGPGQTRIEVRQRKAGKEEPEETVIEIFTILP